MNRCGQPAGRLDSFLFFSFSHTTLYDIRIIDESRFKTKKANTLKDTGLFFFEILEEPVQLSEQGASILIIRRWKAWEKWQLIGFLIKTAGMGVTTTLCHDPDKSPSSLVKFHFQQLQVETSLFWTIPAAEADEPCVSVHSLHWLDSPIKRYEMWWLDKLSKCTNICTCHSTRSLSGPKAFQISTVRRWTRQPPWSFTTKARQHHHMPISSSTTLDRGTSPPPSYT